jgi:folate-binding protein YgfZ
MTTDLETLQKAAGATFESEDGDRPVPDSFGNDGEAIAAARNGVALCDRRHWGRLQLSGDDKLRFLHNQSTNDFQRLQPGRGCETVFVTSTARTIDLVSAYVTETAVLLLVSPNRRQKMLQWLDRYIFPADKVELSDLTETTGMFSLIGPEADRLLKQWDIAAPQTDGSHAIVAIDGTEVRLCRGSGVGLPGYTLICEGDRSASLWQSLTEAGAVPMGDRAWERLRVEQGRPASDRELTDDYNPLEAGLWQTISFDKGCYIGQETIARLNTYKGVKQQLWGVRLDRRVEPETPVTVGEDKVGKLTSCTVGDTGAFGLAYIRTKAGGEGLSVRVGEAQGEVVAVPFLTRGYPTQTSGDAAE